jgi:ribosome maturation factor RimP
MNSREELAQVAESVCKVEGVELYWLDYRRGSGTAVVRVFIDKPGGVTISDCERVSNALEPRFDELILHRYFLEVSSPGIERQLHTEEHFRRVVGELIRVKTHHPIAGRRVLIGRLIGLDPELILETKSGPLQIPWEELSQARVLSPPDARSPARDEEVAR